MREYRTIHCSICGEYFKSNAGNVKYCSPECAANGKTMRSRSWASMKLLNERRMRDERYAWTIKREQKEDIYDRIDAIKEEIGCDWVEFARGCGLCYTTIFNFISGKRSLSLDSVAKISIYTGKSVDYILGF